MSNFFSHSTRNTFRALFTAFALSALLTASGLALGVDDVPELPAANGSSYTPEIIIPMIDKKELKLSSLRGKVVMLDFFWTQCVHCQEHAPHVTGLYQKFRNRGFTVLGLATDEQTKNAEVREFMKKYKLTYPVGFNTMEATAYFTDSHNRGVPQMVLFGPDGRMVLRHIGWDEKVAKELNTIIEAQLSKLAPANAPARSVKPGSKPGAKAGARRTARA